MGEYLEESPLGKAEWMIVLSELTDKREKGIEDVYKGQLLYAYKITVKVIRPVCKFSCQ